MKIKPLSDRVIIEPIEDEGEKTSGGIYIPDTAKEKPQQGKVISVGEGKMTDEGKVLPISIKVGQTVIYSKYAGSEYKSNGVKYLIVRESDVLAVLE